MFNQKGFTTVAVSLVLITIVSIILGYYLLTKKETTSRVNELPSVVISNPTSTPLNNGKITKDLDYLNNLYGFQVFIPEGWFFPVNADDTKVSPYITFSISNYDHSDITNFDKNTYNLSSNIKSPVTLQISIDTTNTKSLKQLRDEMLNHTIQGGGEAPDVTFTKAEETTFANKDALILYSNLGKSVLLLNDKNYLYTISDITDPNPKVEDPKVQELSRKVISSFKLIN